MPVSVLQLADSYACMTDMRKTCTCAFHIHIRTNTYTCMGRFVPVSVLQLVESEGALVNIEPELHGKFVKHNDNDGNVESKELVRHF